MLEEKAHEFLPLLLQLLVPGCQEFPHALVEIVAGLIVEARSLLPLDLAFQSNVGVARLDVNQAVVVAISFEREINVPIATRDCARVSAVIAGLKDCLGVIALARATGSYRHGDPGDRPSESINGPPRE